MASLSTSAKGLRRIRSKARDGQRKSIRLGRLPKKESEVVRNYISRLEAAQQVGGPPDSDTAAWLRRITDELHGKISAVGLVKPRNEITVGKLFDDFVKANSHVKPATVVVWGQVARCLKEYLGEDRPIRSIGRAEAEGFRQWLIERVAATTTSKRLQFARQFFAHATNREWIDCNPFKGVSHKGGNPRERQHYISEDETLRLIEAAPNWVWRTIIALARFGGLRCPSEVLSLRFADLDWENGRMAVISPKTGNRNVPIFATLRPYLEEAWDAAEDRQTHVIPETLYLPAANGPRGWNGCNLRTTFQKIVARAGLNPWPRLFHNLRASCESDLAREYPIATVCSWIGNTVAIAARHYIQVTDADFERACCRTSEAALDRAHLATVRAR